VFGAKIGNGSNEYLLNFGLNYIKKYVKCVKVHAVSSIEYVVYITIYSLRNV